MDADKIKVLIISRNPELILPVDVEILPDSRFDLRVATSALEALRETARERPNLLLAHYAAPPDLHLLRAYRREDAETPAVLLVPERLDAVPADLLKMFIVDTLVLPLDPDAAPLALEAAYEQGRARIAYPSLQQEMAEARQELSKRSSALTTLHGVGRSLSTVLDTDRLLSYVIDAAVHLVMADEGSILISEASDGGLAVKAQRSTREKSDMGDRLRVEDSLARMVMQTGQTLLIADMAASTWTADHAAAPESQRYIHSLLNVPFRIGEKQVGVLSVVNKATGRSFDHEDTLLLSVLIDYVAIALENAAKYSDSQRAAATGVFRQTVAALSHYINNPLAALMAGVHNLASSLRGKGHERPAAPELQTLQVIEQKAAEIAAVISVLQEIVIPTSTQYWREERMIDIERDLRGRLAQARRSGQDSQALR